MYDQLVVFYTGIVGECQLSVKETSTNNKENDNCMILNAILFPNLRNMKTKGVNKTTSSQITQQKPSASNWSITNSIFHVV